MSGQDTTKEQEAASQTYYEWLSEKASGGAASAMSYPQWAKEKGYDTYEAYLPWLENKYLSWFTNDNKASYATKEELDKTKVTGIEPVNKLQDGVNSTVGGQLGKGGLGEGVGNTLSKEGVDRAEEGAQGDKDQAGGYGQSAMNAGSSAASGVGGAVSGGLSGVQGVLGGGEKK
ncbi:MAG: hypothetical protein M1828_000448 [Chrysothrix sp. TS-e1954]|nr:MAG: hypothetical protein M1828_000448 [Chrysothrix sp. TS-e1954]